MIQGKEVNPSFSHLCLFLPTYGFCKPLPTLDPPSLASLIHKRVCGMRQDQLKGRIPNRQALDSAETLLGLTLCVPLAFPS